MSGLDNLVESYYISVDAQTAYLQKGAGSTATILSYRFSVPVSTITSVINSNRDAYVVLFSKSCEYALSIAKFMKGLNLPLDRLYINECYSTSSPTLKIVTDAIAQGVPTSNVFSGDKPGVGSKVPNHSKLQGRIEHNQSLEPLGKVILSRFGGGTPPTNGQSVAGSSYIPPTTTPSPPAPVTNQTQPTGDPNQLFKPQTVQTTDEETKLYYETILKKLGAPATEGNLIFFRAWRQSEGGSAVWNGFNTTLKKPGSTKYNSVGVRNYVDFDQGASAIVETLLNTAQGQYYKNIVAALRKGIKDQAEALNYALEWQKQGQDLYIWVRGPRGTEPLDRYVAAVLKGNVRYGYLRKLADGETMIASTDTVTPSTTTPVSTSTTAGSSDVFSPSVTPQPVI